MDRKRWGSGRSRVACRCGKPPRDSTSPIGSATNMQICPLHNDLLLPPCAKPRAQNSLAAPRIDLAFCRAAHHPHNFFHCDLLHFAQSCVLFCLIGASAPIVLPGMHVLLFLCRIWLPLTDLVVAGKAAALLSLVPPSGGGWEWSFSL